MQINIALNSHFETFIQEQINSGYYNDITEIIDDALQLLENRQKQKRLDLSSAISTGLQGQGQAAEIIFNRLENKYQAMAEK
jgi:antitoxin ParD1/3/4